VETLPEIDPVRLMTQRLRAYVEQESLKRSFVSIADDVGIDEKTVRRIFRDYLRPFDERGMLYRARLFQQLAAEVLNLAEAGMV
jgi:methylphosphotriester-DNA--protein-cysteine methyltransferase